VQNISAGNFPSLYATLIFMLTQRDVIAQLKRIGVKEPSLREIYLRDFEKYMEINYGLKIGKEEKIQLKREEGPKLD